MKKLKTQLIHEYNSPITPQILPNANLYNIILIFSIQIFITRMKENILLDDDYKLDNLQSVSLFIYFYMYENPHC